MKKIIPLGKNILIKLAEVEKITKGGIILPGNEIQEKSQQGKVVAVGESDKIDAKIKVGEKIIFDKYEGSEIEFNKEKFAILESKKVLAIIK